MIFNKNYGFYIYVLIYIQQKSVSKFIKNFYFLYIYFIFIIIIIIIIIIYYNNNNNNDIYYIIFYYYLGFKIIHSRLLWQE
jgi:hypothetical protein